MYEENVGGNRQPTRAILSKDFTYICNLWSDGVRKFATATKGMAATKEMERLGKEGDAAMQQRYDLFTYNVPEQFFDLNKDADALNNLIDNPEYKQLIGQYQKQMVKTMKASSDPMLGIFQNRTDKEAVQGYLAQLDAASKDRKSKAEIYKRGHGAKAKEAKPSKVEKKASKAMPAAEGTTLEEHLARNKERAEKKGKPFSVEQSTRWFHAKDKNNDGVIDENEKKAKVKL